MKPVVLLDTNVWVAAFLNKLGRPARVIKALEIAVTGGAGYLVRRDDDLKRDLDLVQQMKASGVRVVNVSQFLATL